MSSHLKCLPDSLENLVVSTGNSPKVDPSFSDDRDSNVKRDISELEKRIAAIDLSVSSTQRSLEVIYRHKTDLDSHLSKSRNGFPKFSFLRRTRSFLDFIGWRPHSTNFQNKLTSASAPAAIDNEITQTEDTLQRLIGERQTLTFDLVNRKGELISRHEKLPVELWARIFLLCLPDEEFITPDPRQAPLLLCQVCSQWRNVATSTPFLWNALAIRSSWRKRIWKSSLDTWLNRSSNALLYLDISAAVDREISGADHHLFQSIIATSDRWEHLRLNIANPLLRSMMKSDMPQLQTLEIYTTEYITNLHLSPVQVPRLKVISFLTKTVYLHAHFLPWRQLTHLDSRCWLNISQHAAIISKCPNLRSYSMSLVNMALDPMWDFETREIFHPRIEVLKIMLFVDTFTDPTKDIQLFHLPNLSEFALVIADENPFYGILGWPKAEILSLIQRSSCSLKKLHFRGISMSQNDILNLQRLLHLPHFVQVHDPSITFFA
ncbi:hypothetical protein BDN70DRAFT_368699 [Pholiota conissans]|uniref:F-box domain-containing protein n=1 Tax=Pholiota conissans TaxID=109636 RepID=A0A9P6D7Q7_9AGAR|nr:hypothetical protein BDN70DRAFT_368699 [Pholiota conissans]